MAKQNISGKMACAIGALGALWMVSAATPAVADSIGFLNDYKVPEFNLPVKPYKIIVLQAHRQDAYAESSALAFEQFGKQYGMSVTDLEAGGYEGRNVQKQIEQIETAITQKPDALVIWSTDPTAIVPALKEASAAGIKIVACCQSADFPTAEATVTGDFVQDGYTLATSLFKRIGGKGKVISVFGAAGSAYQAMMTEGFNKAAKENPDITVVATPLIPNFSPAQVETIVENYLAKEPDLKGVVTMSTEMALAASKAIKDAGRQGKAFAVAEILGDCSQVQAIKDGTLPIILGVPAIQIARVTMATTVRVLQGLPVPKTQLVPRNIYTPDNIDKAPLDLEADPKFLGACMKK